MCHIFDHEHNFDLHQLLHKASNKSSFRNDFFVSTKLTQMNRYSSMINRKHTLIYYCKCGYFCWGEISLNCWQDISRGGNFQYTAPISFIKAYGFKFRVEVIFAKKTKARKTLKLPPRENFHVYSIFNSPGETILLLPSLEGERKICSTQNSYAA